MLRRRGTRLAPRAAKPLSRPVSETQAMRREPLFNIPTIVAVVVVVLAAIHGVRTFLLTDRQDVQLLLLFAFIPARYESTLVLGGAFPGGFSAQVWSFVTYSLLHADWTHLSVNAMWLLPFGSALARRFGALRFVAFLAVTAIAGALAHLITHVGEQFPVIGASASVSGTMSAAMCFAFSHGGGIGFWAAGDEAYRQPAPPLLQALRNPQVIIFAVVWFGFNALFGLGTLPVPGAEGPVAWEAHIGGFLAGVLLFPLFDPIPKATSAGK